MPVDRTRVLVVDDDGDMRLLVRLLAEQTAGVEVVGEAVDAEEAIAAWRATAPDVVVLDYLMPGRNGLEVAGQILGERPQQAIVLFSANLDPATVVTAEAVGVCDVLDKDRVRELPGLLQRCHERANRPPDG